MLKNLVALLSILAFAGVAFANTHADKKTEAATEKMEGEHHGKKHDDKHHGKKHDDKHHEEKAEDKK